MLLRRCARVAASHAKHLQHGVRSNGLATAAKALTFDAFGQPEEVLKLRDVDLPNVGAKDMLIKMLAVRHANMPCMQILAQM